MTDARKLGRYYKEKTKKMFVELGYETEYLEKLQMYVRPDGKGGFQRNFLKRDLFGADGLSMNNEHMIFWNAKYTEKTDNNNAIIREVYNDFFKHKFPSKDTNVIIAAAIWRKKQKPILVNVVTKELIVLESC